MSVSRSKPTFEAIKEAIEKIKTKKTKSGKLRSRRLTLLVKEFRVFFEKNKAPRLISSIIIRNFNKNTFSKLPSVAQNVVSKERIEHLNNRYDAWLSQGNCFDVIDCLSQHGYYHMIITLLFHTNQKTIEATLDQAQMDDDTKLNINNNPMSTISHENLGEHLQNKGPLVSLQNTNKKSLQSRPLKRKQSENKNNDLDQPKKKKYKTDLNPQNFSQIELTNEKQLTYPYLFPSHESFTSNQNPFESLDGSDQGFPWNMYEISLFPSKDVGQKISDITNNNTDESNDLNPYQGPFSPLPKKS